MRRELGRWQVRPYGEKGVAVADGDAAVDAPRYFNMFSHGNTVAHTFREALYTVTSRSRGPERLQRVHDLLLLFRGLRSHLQPDEAVPDTLLMGIGHANNLLASLARHSPEDSETPVETVVRCACCACWACWACCAHAARAAVPSGIHCPMPICSCAAQHHDLRLPLPITRIVQRAAATHITITPPPGNAWPHMLISAMQPAHCSQTSGAQPLHREAARSGWSSPCFA